MSKRETKYFFDGNAALETQKTSSNRRQARIIPFPERCSEDMSVPQAQSALKRILRQANDLGKRVLRASEMYCSLRYEDSLGVLYQVFSRSSIGALTIACAIVAVFSIAVGA